MPPVIGITMCYDNGRFVRPGINYDIIRREYGEQVRAAGAQPIFLDGSIDPTAAARLCDGIVISGGWDINPAFYEGKKVPTDDLEPRERTAWERRLIAACDKQRIPILGICYGAQLLNVHYGGTLYQDIPTEIPNSNGHQDVLHEVTFSGPFMGFETGESRAVAARHHQSIKNVAPGFRVVATTSDGVVEAIAGRGHFGVQWHAEADATAPQIYSAFVNACTKRSLPKAWAKSWNQLRTRTKIPRKNNTSR